MKKLIIVVAVVLGALVAYNYVTTGELKLLPGASLSAEEREVADLEKRFDAARKEAAQAHRAAGATGIDMTADVESVRRSIRSIRQALDDLNGRLTTDAARQKADRLARAIRDYSRELQ
jgi:hypothetical protein